MRKLTSPLLLGGAGFIGSALVRQILNDPEVEHLTVLDNFTTGRRENLTGPDQDPRLHIIEGDLCDTELLEKIITQHQITGLINLAAASPDPLAEDNSPQQASPYTRTNLQGAAVLLDAAQRHKLPLLLNSTDEVYGNINSPAKFTEISPLKPTTPFAASKAAADLLAHAHHVSQQVDLVIARASCTYGPRLQPHTLIHRLALNALRDEPLQLQSDGMTIRDWIHLDDHCQALVLLYKKAKPGHIFNLGGNCERTEIGLARSILKILDKPESLIAKAPEHLPHPINLDRRHALDTTKANTYFAWKPQKSFANTFPDLIREICAQNQHLL